ncbi:glycosyltransferase [Belliella aquatica]|uniref:Glycosyl transferase n=1 Tax=Belliella aquatica TaxID=1323734 RepID=A0ABQ1ME02_9BACT|nr:glycosyltransferase [Belliella aquatica]MCH7405693.1 glycosyltransferase [Belliella aquatica]GGC37049.1 glycosyl transferase [Belliella aquatica]
MKIGIIGPVQSDKYFGGVATFVEAIADSYGALGNEVKIITDYSNKKSTSSGININAVSAVPIRRSIILPFLLYKKIKKENFDLIITSLEFGIVSVFIKNSNTKKVHFLHAFPAVSMAGVLKRFLLNHVMKLIGDFSDLVVSNSSITSLVNKEVFGIRSDVIIPIGLNKNFLNNDLSNSKDKIKGRIVYAGRLANEKNVLKIIEAFKFDQIKDLNGIDFHIIGNGPISEKVKEEIEKYDLKINLRGSLSNEEVFNELKIAEVFISMNPHEPFGIAYLEALFANCKIVAPFSGGQIDYFYKFSNHFYLCNPYNVIDISDKILKSLTDDIPEFNTEILNMNYDKVVEDLNLELKKRNIFQ